ncbi:hypothetical protein QJS10_CPA07g00417 [Acorus calamus]|uniref:ATP synthase subunit d, mitochondrial n=1 Tax=Acorus calamus TaxID=4465 RepID=A0AAV9EGK6_ACOCL|nr:hypothetical protein QJS10_CPA07g00417 [Acorus calamus]
MSGRGVKKAVDAAKTIDWEGMARMIVSDEARREFNSLRATFQEVDSTIRTKFCLEPEPIDWDRYRKSIGSRLVDMYKEAYEMHAYRLNYHYVIMRELNCDREVEIPKYVDTVTPEYQPKFDALLVNLKKVEQDSLKETERLEKEIASFKEEKAKLSTMTADEYFARHPDLKKKFDDEIRNDYWGY